jgi:trigger factor
MQVTQTLTEGLKREFQVVVPAADLDQRVSTRLDDLKTKVRINGFRPGKVPVSHLRRVYGKAVFGEVLQEVMSEVNRRIVDEGKVKLAMQPQYKGLESEAEFEEVASGKHDLSYKVEIEVLPEIQVGDLKAISIEKPVADVSDAEVDEALARIAKGNRAYEPRAEGAAAEAGDRVVMDYAGTIDGAAFEGGTGTDIQVDIGSNGFIPGFEEQLIGAKAGETRTVTAAFPENYGRADLAGKTGVFEVTVKAVQAPQERAIDDELAKSLGLESLDKLKEAVRGQIEREHGAASRQKMKRALLDALDAGHKFEVPQTLLEQEFAGIWSQVERDIKAGVDTEGKSEDDLRTEYRAIAERRVRLGLLLAEIGEKANIQIAEDDLNRALFERSRQFPGRERQIWDYYRNNPDAMAELRAPIFEEKVVDYIAELATVAETKVSREELFADTPEGEGA